MLLRDEGVQALPSSRLIDPSLSAPPGQVKTNPPVWGPLDGIGGERRTKQISGKTFQLFLVTAVDSGGDELVHEDGEIKFETNKAELLGKKTDATLEAYAEVLEDYPDVHLRIEGHTDSRGSDGLNRKLSDARAHAVKKWLVNAGTDKKRLEAVGLGEDSPAMPESADCKNVATSEAPSWCEDQVWAHNRRSQFHVTSGLETLPENEELTSVSSKGDTGPVPALAQDRTSTSRRVLFGCRLPTEMRQMPAYCRIDGGSVLGTFGAATSSWRAWAVASRTCRSRSTGAAIAART